MVKLTTELIDNAKQYYNAIKDRELDLRDYKIPVIENLGSTYDQFDVIDFTNNEIRKLDGFPTFQRLKTLLLSNNRIARLGDTLAEQLPNLRWLVLTNNNIAGLGDIDDLAKCRSLQHLCLLSNPIVSKQHYRLYLVYRLPQLRVLDYKRVRLAERQKAKALFGTAEGKALQATLVKRSTAQSATFTPGQLAAMPPSARLMAEQEMEATTPAAPKTMDAGDVKAIKEAIAKASSLEEVERLNKLLESGQIPGRESNGEAAVNGQDAEMEEMDD